MTPESNPSGRRRLGIRSGLAVTAAVAISVLAGMNLRSPAAHASGAVVAPVSPSDRSLPSASGVSYADLASRVSPSVVTVRSERVAKPASQEFALPDDPFFHQFFGRGFQGIPSQPRREGGLGSGVIVSEDGYVLTNHHVVASAQRILVDLADRRTFRAKLVGSDAASDLALLKIDATGLTPLPFGDSKSARVGDVVLAFGNPLGVGQTVTMGIISAKGRATDPGNGSFEDFLQTDAPINQGNSGGALVNVRGELIGVNSQIVSPSGGSVGIGFAIPAAMAENVMNQLIHGGQVHRGQLGVTVQAVTSDIAKSLGMAEVKGALVSDVSAGSPGGTEARRRDPAPERIGGRRRQRASQPGLELRTGLQDRAEGAARRP
jgi:serine protease Do